MNRIFFSDTIQKKYPNAAKMLESCKKDRPTEILGLLEALLAQTGLNPEEPFCLGFLRRAFALGQYVVGGPCNKQYDVQRENSGNTAEKSITGEPERQKTFEDLFVDFGEFHP